MSNDLISREALIKELEQRHLDDVFIKRGLPLLREMSLECNRALEAQGSAIRDVINGLPAVDAEPVRHGEWIYQDGEIMLCKTCSLCRCESFDLDGAEYCPYCGAKMDLEDEQ